MTPGLRKHIPKGVGKTQDQLWGYRTERGTGIGTEALRGWELQENQNGGATKEKEPAAPRPWRMQSETA
ncbi:hypothetical protein NDU88_005766 [Pleurodeles waltl]|uniref:Uncharacterized protein n=1 Tax=Pleurodeles waltl TaxID=8319 RepID=A0AAV7UJP4_PLEWA|nr:hypothetical protein NDU88_005766 [Pleurodeles waltl]